jgi:small subunit ribosomal protein S4
VTKIISSKYKVSRRLGTSIWGDDKDAIHKKNYKPGQHGPRSRGGISSDFKKQLEAKQKLKAHYGRITERQMKNTFKVAQKKRGSTTEIFINLLETRLDAVVYRGKFASSIFAARQFVSHKHILVNGRVQNIPSFKVKPGDVLSIKNENLLLMAKADKSPRQVPDYIEADESKNLITFIREPNLDEVPYPFELSLNLIVEFYAKN